MPELIKLIIGIASIITGSIVIGLLIALTTVIGKLVALWIWIFSICVVCGGISLVFVVII